MYFRPFGVSTVNYRINLNLLCFPVPVSIRKNDLVLDPTVIANRTEILDCPAVGIPPPKLTWYKDGAPLDTTNLRHMRLLQVKH